MKFTTDLRERLTDRTINGTTHQVKEQYAVQRPKAPADWDARAIKAAYGAVLALTLISVIWSTVSIGQLLEGGVGYLAAVLFDLAWLINVLLEYLARFDPVKRVFAKRLGWSLLVATMGAILWHGLAAGSAALGVVGAAVSLFAKVLWMGVMKFVNRDLDPMDQQWVEKERSAAYAKEAIATVQRQTARAEQRAVAELLAAQQIRADLQGYLTAAQEVAPAPVELTATVSAPAAIAPAPAVDPSGLAELVAALSAPVAAAVSARLSAPEDKAETVRPDNFAVRPDLAKPLFLAPETPEIVRPDESGAPLQEPASADKMPELVTVSTGTKPSVAAAIRELLASGITDPDALRDMVPVLLNRQVNETSVKREIRRQRPAVVESAPEPGTGQYL